MLGSVKNINDYCSSVYKGLTDMKDKINDMVRKADSLPADERRMVLDNFFSPLTDLSHDIDSKLETITRYCPNWRGEKKPESPREEPSVKA